jgi:hypothetical protein
MSNKSNLPEPPSFEPWAGRVRLSRAAIAAGTFLFVGATTYTSGLPLPDAALRAMAGAVTAYFVAWGAALWLCSELYYAQVARKREELMRREDERARQLSDIYTRRIGGVTDGHDETRLTPMEPPAPSQRAA